MIFIVFIVWGPYVAAIYIMVRIIFIYKFNKIQDN